MEGISGRREPLGKPRLWGIRGFLRKTLLVTAIVLVAYRSLDMAKSYHNWRESLRIGDRSGADFYHMNLEIDCGEIAAILGVLGLGAFLLRPKSGSR